MVDDYSHLITVTLTTTQYNTNHSRVFDIFMEIEDILAEAVSAKRLGIVDGHEFCVDPHEETLTYFIYGSDVEKILDAIAPIVSMLPKTTNPRLRVRYNLPAR